VYEDAVGRMLLTMNELLVNTADVPSLIFSNSELIPKATDVVTSDAEL
jgi:hypothetical protein